MKKRSIREGAIILTPDERQQIENLIPKIITALHYPQATPGRAYDIGKIVYKYADGEDGEVMIKVGNTGQERTAGGFYTDDPNNRKDNVIVVNQEHFAQLFPKNIFQKLDRKLLSTFTGTGSEALETLRGVLRHELIHAKDPAVNHHHLNEPYSNDEKVYYKSWTEFQTMTGQFFEALVAGTNTVLARITNQEGDSVARGLLYIQRSLSNILRFYAGKDKSIRQETDDFITGTGTRNLFQKVFNFVYQIVGGQSTPFEAYRAYLSKIKQHNPEGYKEFLKDLYKIIKVIEDQVNKLNLSPTKIKIQEIHQEEVKVKQSLQEVKRMQLLAGIIKEQNNH